MSVVLVERPAEYVALVRFNRPDVMNALNVEVQQLVNRHFIELSAADNVRCIVLTGNDKVFAAGADINEMRDRTIVEAMNEPVASGLRLCRKPVIAAVNGYALGGGCEYVMQCDFSVASEDAKFGQPEVKLGIVPGAGGTQYLPRAVGKYNGLYMLLTGRFISAQDALRMGLVSEVVSGNCEPRAIELAKQIAALPPITVMKIKEAVLTGRDVSLEAGLRIEAQAHQLMFGTEDLREGTAAFAEKRKPQFKGR